MSTDVALAGQLKTFQSDVERLRGEIARVIVGQRAAVDGVLIGLFAGGHVLLEGLPGLGKTLLVRTLAEATELVFRRLQFTPDLMPADVIGTYVVMESAGRRKFEFQQGPIFANLVLADEINRATPKTQAALLEAMQESAVTVANETYDLPDPFLVVATQGPDAGEGTFPLPEKQLDRFLLKVSLSLPSPTEMEEVVNRTTDPTEPAARPVLTAGRLLEMSQVVRQVAIEPDARRYAVRLVTATHADHDTAPPLVKQFVRYGASPRGAQALVLAAKAQAAMAGRARASIDDVRKLAEATLAHRLTLNFDGQAEHISPESIVGELTAKVAP
ncbi:MAG: MoxR family ATPase [Planctomycetia bacterium]|nr:MoxR family ATPase [Planctomycetia bacterium]